MEKYKIFGIYCIFILGIWLFACLYERATTQTIHTQEVVNYPPYMGHTYGAGDEFFDGEILYPDFIHEDTLVVINVLMLEWWLSYPEIEEEDILTILKQFTKSYSQ